jgi:hypothetical protein
MFYFLRSHNRVRGTCSPSHEHALCTQLDRSFRTHMKQEQCPLDVQGI